MSLRSYASPRSLAAAAAVSVVLRAAVASAQPAPPPPAPPAPPAADAAPPAAWVEEPASAAPADAPSAKAPPAEDAAPSSDEAPVEVLGPKEPSDATYTAPPSKPLPKYRQYDLGAEIGMRNVLATDPSYEPYSSDDLLTSFAIGATWTPLHVAPLSFGLVGEWSPGGTTGRARGDETSVFVNRVALGAQARLDLGRRVYLHAKVTPSLLLVSANIDDPAIPRPLESHSATWGLDATGGAAVLIGRAGDPDAPAFRVWLVGEAGWAFTGAAEMSYAPAEDEDDPRLYGGVQLAALDTSGFVNRLSVAVTF